MFACSWAWCLCWYYYSYLMMSGLSQIFNWLQRRTLKVHLVIRTLRYVCLSLHIPQELERNKRKRVFSLIYMFAFVLKFYILMILLASCSVLKHAKIPLKGIESNCQLFNLMGGGNLIDNWNSQKIKMSDNSCSLFPHSCI